MFLLQVAEQASGEAGNLTATTITAITGLIAALFTGLAAYISSLSKAKSSENSILIETLKESLQVKDDTLIDLQRQIARYEGQVEALQQQITSYQNELKAKDIVIQGKELEIQKLNSKIDKLVERIENIEQNR